MSITCGLVLPPKPMVTTAKVLVAPSPVLAAVSWPMSVLISQNDTWWGSIKLPFQLSKTKTKAATITIPLKMTAVSWPTSVLNRQKKTREKLSRHCAKGNKPRNSWRWWWGVCRSGGCRSQGCGRTWTWGRRWTGCRSSLRPPSSNPSSSWPMENCYFSIGRH